jgi:hypothetical protein
VEEWWTTFVQKRGHLRRAMAFLAMLVSSKVRKERNARVFLYHLPTVTMVVSRIKEDTKL